MSALGVMLWRSVAVDILRVLDEQVEAARAKAAANWHPNQLPPREVHRLQHLAASVRAAIERGEDGGGAPSRFPVPKDVYPRYTDDRSAVTRIAQVIAHEMGHGGNEEAAARSIVLEVERGWIGFPESSRDAAGATVAAPAVPPSVAEARDRWSNAMCDLVLAMTAGATDDRDAIPGDYEAALQGLEAARDDLLAAVRAATVAEAVRVVEQVPGAVTLLQAGVAIRFHFHNPADARSSEVPRADAIAALRALADAPDPAR